MPAVIAFAAGVLLGTYARGKWARAGAQIDAALADLHDVPLGEEQITEAETRAVPDYYGLRRTWPC